MEKLVETNRISKKKKRTKKNVSKFLSKTKSHVLEESEYNYFITLFKNIKNSDGLDKADQITVFFDEFAKEKGARLVCCNVTSRLVEELLPLGSAASVLKIVDVLSLDLWTMCTDSFASHVLQSVLMLCLQLLQEDAVQTVYDDDENKCIIPISEEEKAQFTSFVVKVSKYCSNNLAEFICNLQATHIIRTLLMVLSGNRQAKNMSSCGQFKSKQSATIDVDGATLNVPLIFEELLNTLCDRLMRINGLPELLMNEHVSGDYQYALKVLRKKDCSDACERFAQHLLQFGLASVVSSKSDDSVNFIPLGGSSENERLCRYDDSPKLHPIFEYNATSRLLEVIIECSNRTTLLEVFTKYFAGNAKLLVQHRSGNFALQRFLSANIDQELLEKIGSELLEAVTEAFSCSHTGVLLTFVQACERLKTLQGKCSTALMSALDCYSSDEKQLMAAPALLFMLPHEQCLNVLQQLSQSSPDQTTLPAPVSLHGSLMLQSLLKYNKPIRWVRGLLELSTMLLCNLAEDAKGCHIVDAFCSSPTVGEKSRLQLVTKLQGCAERLACSKHGSRVLEILWDAATPALRVSMCQQLYDAKKSLKSNQFGTIIFFKFNVRLFGLSDKSEWTRIEESKIKKRKLMKELLAEDAFERPSKKKKAAAN